jgi:hypothetical protein
MKRHSEQENFKLNQIFIQSINRSTDSTKKEMKTGLENFEKDTAETKADIIDIKKDTAEMKVDIVDMKKDAAEFKV